MLHPILQFPGPRALFDHAGAAFAIERGKIWRQQRWHLGVGPVRNRQFLKKRAERQVVLLQTGEPFLEINPENVARALGIRLGVRSAHRFFRTIHRRRTRRREKQSRDNAANDRAVKALVVDQIGQDWESRSCPAARVAPGACPSPFSSSSRSESNKGARIADDDKRLRLDAAARFGPEIAGIVEAGPVAERAAINFPGRSRDDQQSSRR